MSGVKYTFENDYGASVIDHGYGSKEGLFELAVLHNGHLCYASSITDDVIGWCDQGQIDELLLQIKALPPIPHQFHANKRYRNADGSKKQ